MGASRLARPPLRAAILNESVVAVDAIFAFAFFEKRTNVSLEIVSNDGARISFRRVITIIISLQ